MEIRAELKLRNGAIVRARKERGWNQRKLAAESNTSVYNIMLVERMQFRRKSVREAAVRVSVVLGLELEAVLPVDMEEDVLSDITMTKEVDTAALLAYSTRLQGRMILPAPDETDDANSLSEVLTSVLSALPQRSQDILMMRFGIKDGHIYTLEELGTIYGVSRERIRGIEAAALEKLQHPVRKRKLEAFVECEEVEDNSSR